MFKLLNRFSWLISILIGFLISFLLFALLGEIKVISDGEIFFFFIFVFLFGCIFKSIFLSKDFIEERLEFFAKSLLKNYLGRDFHDGLIKSDLKISKNSSYIEKEPELTDDSISKSDFIESKNKALNNISDSKQSQSNRNEFNKVDLKNSSYISSFFSENILAKLGGILVFLGVLFFLGLIYNNIGELEKIGIGILIGIIFIISGVFLEEVKNINKESKVLIGIGLLINYLVILFGRHLLDGTPYLTETITFIFLIANTVLAIFLSLKYKSNILLLFSFIFAYINPLLVGSNTDTPYTLLLYILVISFGSFFLSFKQKDIIILIMSFLLGNFIMLLSPINDSLHFISSIISLNIFNILAICSSTIFRKQHKLILEFLFGGVFFILGFFVLNHNSYLISLNEFSISIFISLVFLFFSYFLSKKYSYLYSIGTSGAILTLAPIISISLEKDMYIFISVLAILILSISNFVFPFINQKLFNPGKSRAPLNLIIGSIITALFIGFNLYSFGLKYFPGIYSGILFLFTSFIYFFQSFVFIYNFGINKVRKNENLKNVFYNFIGIGITFFSISIAFLFSSYPSIISLLWIFLSTLVFYFFYRFSNFKLYLIASILFLAGIIKLILLFNTFNPGDINFIFILFLILISLSLNLNFLFSRKNSLENTNIYGNIHCVLHIFGVLVITSIFFEIISKYGNINSIFFTSIFILVLSIIYSYFSSKILKYFFLIFIGIFMFVNTIQLGTLFSELDNNSFKYLQYISTLVISLSVFFWNKINLYKGINFKFNLFLFLYLFSSTSLYVFDLFNSTFAITIYWGILAFSILFYGIGNDLLKFRTIGLYIVSITAFKIFFHDIWYGIDDAFIRVLALIIIGILFIVISIKYTKRFGNNLNHEFSLYNLRK